MDRVRGGRALGHRRPMLDGAARQPWPHARRGRTSTVAERPPWPHARHGTVRRVGEGALLALGRLWGTEREREVSVGEREQPVG